MDFVNGQTIVAIADFVTDNDNPENVTTGMKLKINDIRDENICVDQVGDSSWDEDQWINKNKLENVKDDDGMFADSEEEEEPENEGNHIHHHHHHHHGDDGKKQKKKKKLLRKK